MLNLYPTNMARLGEDQERVFQLRCPYQTFQWGKHGMSSLVAQLLKNVDDSLQIERNTAYSEMWMGTHCLGPSRIVKQDGTEEDLGTWLSKNDDVISLVDGADHHNHLPFLFKVISIQKTLSLQAHPDKTLAAELHSQNPDVYKDGNHKPEMAIAINNFRALAGFKPIPALARYLEDIVELRKIVGIENSNRLISVAATQNVHLSERKEVLKQCFIEVFAPHSTSSEKRVLFEQLVSRVQSSYEKGEDVSKYEGLTLLKIADEYPGDIGALAVYFLNEIVLQPGEALFIEVNEPHAYLEGDCLECLTCSHNIVRFGLTHKLKDFNVLQRMLKYETRVPEDILVDRIFLEENGCKIIQYLPPTKEFTVTRIEIPSSIQTAKVKSLPSANILICMEGTGVLENCTITHSISLRRGSVMFLSAGESVDIHKQSDSLVLFRAHVP